MQKQILLQKGRRQELRIFDDEYQNETIEEAIKNNWTIVSIHAMEEESTQAYSQE